MGFVKARFSLAGDKCGVEGLALVDSGAWYTVIDEELAEHVGVKYTELIVTLTSFSGHRIACREAVVSSITVEGRTAPFELVAVCSIAEPIKELLRRQEVKDQLVIGVHTLERLGYAVDVVTHKLIESPGILMIPLMTGDKRISAALAHGVLKPKRIQRALNLNLLFRFAAQESC